mmetsp:Transcript_57648/g.158782  ORF Transcript_57648/g.158782 Transcript_57648/m.158782 type:complete len:249 (+) Transcript_57648:888-1634(+)
MRYARRPAVSYLLENLAEGRGGRTRRVVHPQRLVLHVACADSHRGGNRGKRDHRRRLLAYAVRRLQVVLGVPQEEVLEHRDRRRAAARDRRRGAHGRHDVAKVAEVGYRLRHVGRHRGGREYGSRVGGRSHCLRRSCGPLAAGRIDERERASAEDRVVEPSREVLVLGRGRARSRMGEHVQRQLAEKFGSVGGHDERSTRAEGEGVARARDEMDAHALDEFGSVAGSHAERALAPVGRVPEAERVAHA